MKSHILKEQLIYEPIITERHCTTNNFETYWAYISQRNIYIISKKRNRKIGSLQMTKNTKSIFKYWWRWLFALGACDDRFSISGTFLLPSSGDAFYYTVDASFSCVGRGGIPLRRHFTRSRPENYIRKVACVTHFAMNNCACKWWFFLVSKYILWLHYYYIFILMRNHFLKQFGV